MKHNCKYEHRKNHGANKSAAFNFHSASDVCGNQRSAIKAIMRSLGRGGEKKKGKGKKKKRAKTRRGRPVERHYVDCNCATSEANWIGHRGHETGHRGGEKEKGNERDWLVLVIPRAEESSRGRVHATIMGRPWAPWFPLPKWKETCSDSEPFSSNRTSVYSSK